MWATAIRTTFLTLLLAAASVTASSPVGRLYLHPASKGRGRATEVSPTQFHNILAHALSIPGENIGVGAGDREAWDWIESSKSSRSSVEALFADSTRKNVIIFTDLDDDDVKDIFPSTLRNTHQIATPPHVSSFEALIESYASQLSSAIPALSGQLGGVFSASVEGVEMALERASGWLLSDAMAAIGSWQDTVDGLNISEEAPSFRHSIRDLVALLDRGRQDLDNAHEVSSLQALRFNGLGEIKSTYGLDSVKFKEAKKVLRSLLEAAVTKLDNAAADHPQRLAIIALPAQDHALVARSLDPLAPFRYSHSLTPFFTTRDVADTLKKNSSSAPKESDFIGKCFTSEDDLNKATANCSSHGSAIQSSKGGRKCYRCKCQQSKGKGGKIVSWAGAACQKQDLSGPFVLLLTTTVGLMAVIFGSVLYLFYEGQKELPSVLAGISIPNK